MHARNTWNLSAAALLICGVCHAGPPKGGRWKPLPALTDEFDAARLDASKWHPNNPTWKGRLPGFFHTKNVTVRDGKLHLTMRHEDLKGLPKGYHTYTCAAVKSKAKVRYGYFEIKCRAMDSRGSSAFWFYDQTPEVWTEIDVFEIGGGAPKHEHTVHMNAHVFHTPAYAERHWSRGGRWKAPFKLADGYHVYALEWDPRELKYYVDGRLVRAMKNTHWHQPLHMNFDSETMPKWFGLPDVKNLPSTFRIEYVRSWRHAEPPTGAPAKSCTFHFDFERPSAGPKTCRLKPAGGGSLVVVARFNRSGKPARVHVEYDNPAFFKAQTDKTAKKQLTLTDKAGRQIVFTLTWSKNKAQKRNNSYRLETVDVRPAAKPKPPAEYVHEFVTEDGRTVRMKLKY